MPTWRLLRGQAPRGMAPRRVVTGADLVRRRGAATLAAEPIAATHERRFLQVPVQPTQVRTLVGTVAAVPSYLSGPTSPARSEATTVAQEI
jgi:hypothetical protein